MYPIMKVTLQIANHSKVSIFTPWYSAWSDPESLSKEEDTRRYQPIRDSPEAIGIVTNKTNGTDRTNQTFAINILM